jgi:hypothetical protein
VPASPGFAQCRVIVRTPVFSEREMRLVERSGSPSFSQTVEVRGAQEMKHFSSTELPSSACLLENDEKISGAWTKRRLGGGASSLRMELRDGERNSPGA